MRSIIYHCQSPNLPTLPLLKLKHQLTTPKHLWLSSTHQTTDPIQSQRISLVATTRPITTVSLALGFNSGLGFNSPANNTGDLSVLIPTSAVLFFAYWVTNFVVPGIISRYLGLDKRGEELEESNSNNPFDDEKR